MAIPAGVKTIITGALTIMVSQAFRVATVTPMVNSTSLATTASGGLLRITRQNMPGPAV